MELLPAVLRTANDYGLTIGNRTTTSRKKWEVHYAPYDITVVWMRHHRHRPGQAIPTHLDALRIVTIAA
jgi:hypothetical protein